MEQQDNDLVARIDDLAARLAQLQETTATLTEITKVGLVNTLINDLNEARRMVAEHNVNRETDGVCTLMVTPLAVKSLTISPNPVLPGAYCKMCVTLNGPAPIGGALITITENGRDWDTHTIAQGETEATFRIRVGSSSLGPLTFSATYNVPGNPGPKPAKR